LPEPQLEPPQPTRSIVPRVPDDFLRLIKRLDGVVKRRRFKEARRVYAETKELYDKLPGEVRKDYRELMLGYFKGIAGATATSTQPSSRSEILFDPEPIAASARDNDDVGFASSQPVVTTDITPHKTRDRVQNVAKDRAEIITRARPSHQVSQTAVITNFLERSAMIERAIKAGDYSAARRAYAEAKVVYGSLPVDEKQVHRRVMLGHHEMIARPSAGVRTKMAVAETRGEVRTEDARLLTSGADARKGDAVPVDGRSQFASPAAEVSSMRLPSAELEGRERTIRESLAAGNINTAVLEYELLRDAVRSSDPQTRMIWSSRLMEAYHAIVRARDGAIGPSLSRAAGATNTGSAHRTPRSDEPSVLSDTAKRLLHDAGFSATGSRLLESKEKQLTGQRP